MSLKTILAAVDFSPVSAEVIATAAALARAGDARLVLWHVVSLPAAVVGFQLAGEDTATLLAGAEEDAKTRLDSLGQCVADASVETGCSVGLPALDIARKARECGAEFIVVGSHGHGSLYEFLIGTTTQGILRDAPCPVVIVPAARGRNSARLGSAAANVG